MPLFVAGAIAKGLVIFIVIFVLAVIGFFSLFRRPR
jgi:hypothetical protein